MIVEDHLLAVPDEQAAIAAARAWMAGEPPTGCPYEAGADTSKIAMGGILGQAEHPGGKLRILMYWNGPLSPAQSQWHPFEQEFYGLLRLRRQSVEHFGRIPAVLNIDHATIVLSLPGKRLDPKHYRWFGPLH